jgi:hypothetical protein
VRRFGRKDIVSAASKHVHGAPRPAAALERALDRTLAGGLQRDFETMGAAVDAMHLQMRKRLMSRGGGSAIVRVQSNEELFRCTYLNGQCDQFQDQAAIVCGMAAVPIFGAPLIPVCAALGVSAAAYCAAAYYYDCR